MAREMRDDYAEWTEFISKGRNKIDRPIANNTRAVLLEDCIGILLHNTYVVKFFPNGDVELNTGGWYTVTTKDRINGYSPVNVYSDKGLWKCYPNPQMKQSYPQWPRYEDYEGGYDDPKYTAACEAASEKSDKYFEELKESRAKLTVPFFDGIRFNKKGECVNGMPADKWREYEQVVADLRKSIRLYVDRFYRTLKKDGIDVPSAGDCWECAMVTNTGETLGDAGGTHNHLLYHMEENYFVPSLLVNAVKAKGYQPYGVAIHCGINQEQTKFGGPDSRISGTIVKAALRDYIAKRIIPDPPGPENDFEFGNPMAELAELV